MIVVCQTAKTMPPTSSSHWLIGAMDPRAPLEAHGESTEELAGTTYSDWTVEVNENKNRKFGCVSANRSESMEIWSNPREGKRSRVPTTLNDHNEMTYM